MEETPGYPNWLEIKYPVVLSIDESNVRFTDQYGFECEAIDIRYDDLIDMLIFKHCGGAKGVNSYPPFHRIRLEDKSLVGESWTHKLLFRWTGEVRKLK